MLDLLCDGVWSGLLAAAIAVIFSAPPAALLPSFGGGFIARVVRDGLMAHAGVSQPVATLIAAAAVVIVVAPLVRIRRPGISPVVILSSYVPLGAAKAFFAATVGILKAPLLKGEDLAAAPVELLINVSLVLKTTFAIVLGAALGYMIIQTLRAARGAKPNASVT